MAEQFDVVVVGARVAGSPMATLLARRGVKVAVLEQTVFPQPTLSSNVLQADSLAFLDRLGVLGRIQDTKAQFMTRSDTRLNDFRFTADFPSFDGYVGGAACIRRVVLDPILAEEAAAAGADLRMGTKVTGLLEERGRVSGVRFVRNGVESRIRARLVVGADGRESTVARLRGARRYNVTPNERWYYWTYFEGADLTVTPTFVLHRWEDRHIFAGPADHGLYIVGVSPQSHEKEQFRRDRQRSLMEHVRSCEPVAKVLSEARIAEKIYGILRFDGYFRESSGPGWVLIGDAGHFKDPAAGRGIGDAFRQVERLVPAVLRALRGSDAEIDRATGEFARWRDRHYAPFYGLANDLGRVGPLPAVVPDVVAKLYGDGDIDRFLRLFSHHLSPNEVLTPARVLSATARRLAGPERGGWDFAKDVGTTLRDEARRRWSAFRPVFEPTPARADLPGRRTTTLSEGGMT
ncbi:FAD-dependent oxidoreductase [Streptomyces sp. NBC_00631]|uniref:NAD(P)/FAD-dependent oxidoreductase n=1 Tax=Streptomyces sp. NBC_00631 TaxID=2975793 RepID=UPI0030E50FC1